MKYRIVVTKVVKSTKDIEVEAEGLDVMHNSEDADVVRNLASIEAINDDFSDAETTIQYVMGGLQEVEENPYIDQYGEPYDFEGGDSWPAGGGLHKDCDYNADALYAYYAVKDRDKIAAYLTAKGFTPLTQTDDYEEWLKGNTQVIYESYVDGMWGYMHTEFVTVPVEED